MASWIWPAVLLAAIGALAIVVIHLFGNDTQEQQTITAIITFLGPTLAAILAMGKAVEASNQSKQTHESINGVNATIDKIVNGEK